MFLKVLLVGIICLAAGFILNRLAPELPCYHDRIDW